MCVSMCRYVCVHRRCPLWKPEAWEGYNQRPTRLPAIDKSSKWTEHPGLLACKHTAFCCCDSGLWELYVWKQAGISGKEETVAKSASRKEADIDRQVFEQKRAKSLEHVHCVAYHSQHQLSKSLQTQAIPVTISRIASIGWQAINKRLPRSVIAADD